MSDTTHRCLNEKCGYIFDEDKAIRHSVMVKSEFWGTDGITHETVYFCPECRHDQFADIYECVECGEIKADTLNEPCEDCIDHAIAKSAAEDEKLVAAMMADPWPELKDMISDQIEFIKERK